MVVLCVVMIALIQVVLVALISLIIHLLMQQFKKLPLDVEVHQIILTVRQIPQIRVCSASRYKKSCNSVFACT